MGCCKSKNNPKDIQCIEGIYIPKENKNIKKYIPDIKEGLVISVYDGDTITIACNMHWDKYTAYKFNVRLAGIDSPEIRTRDNDQKKVAIIAKKYLESLILNKKIILNDINYDKYGRILANIYLPENQDIPISNLLIQKRLAVVYDGGTKNMPMNWLEYYNGNTNY
jgi:endonuclease YncB( thermonuclease family)